MTRRRKVPLRKCIATGEMKQKQDLIRVVRTKEGNVSVDLTGKQSGRGAYLSLNETAISLAKKKDLLSAVFKMQVDDTIYDELLMIIKEKQGNLNG